MDKISGRGGAEGVVGASGREGGCCLVWAPCGFHGYTKPIASFGKGKPFCIGRWGTYLRSDLFQIDKSFLFCSWGCQLYCRRELSRDIYLLCPFLFLLTLASLTPGREQSTGGGGGPSEKLEGRSPSSDDSLCFRRFPYTSWPAWNLLSHISVWNSPSSRNFYPSSSSTLVIPQRIVFEIYNMNIYSYSHIFISTLIWI